MTGDSRLEVKKLDSDLKCEEIKTKDTTDINHKRQGSTYIYKADEYFVATPDETCFSKIVFDIKVISKVNDVRC